MCLELKAKHAYSEMNDNIIKALSIHCIMIQLAFFTRKKKSKILKQLIIEYTLHLITVFLVELGYGRYWY